MNIKNIPYAHLSYTIIGGVKNYKLSCAIELVYFNFVDTSKPWDWLYNKIAGEHYLTLIVQQTSSAMNLTFDGYILQLPQLLSPGKVHIHIKNASDPSASYHSKVTTNTDDADKEGSGDGGAYISNVF